MVQRVLLVFLYGCGGQQKKVVVPASIPLPLHLLPHPSVRSPVVVVVVVVTAATAAATGGVLPAVF
jgi:hypothetical protein